MDTASERRRNMQRILISSEAYSRWQDIATRLALKTDTEVAAVLMQRFGSADSFLRAQICVRCHGPLSMYCSKCGLEMEVVASTETTHNASQMNGQLQQMLNGPPSETFFSNVCPPRPPASVACIQPVIDLPTQAAITSSVGSHQVQFPSIINSQHLASFLPASGPQIVGSQKDSSSQAHIVSQKSDGSQMPVANFQQLDTVQETADAQLVSTQTVTSRQSAQSCVSGLHSAPSHPLLEDSRSLHVASQSAEPEPAMADDSQFDYIPWATPVRSCESSTSDITCVEGGQREVICQYESEVISSTNTILLEMPDCAVSAPGQTPAAKKKVGKKVRTGQTSREKDWTAAPHQPRPEKKRVQKKGPTRQLSKSFVCKECGAAFAWHCLLKYHMRTHTGERPFSCHMCSSSFCQKHHLTKHMRKHTGERSFVCHVCSDSFYQKGYLLSHMRTHRDGKTKLFVCRACGETFKSRQLFKEHQKEHPIQKSQAADRAGKTFFSLCQLCGQTFESPRLLREHRQKEHNITSKKSMPKSDTEFRPFGCEKCTATFRSLSFLKSHMKVHSDNRPYPCSYCPAAFKNKKERKVHESRHTGDLPYTCTKCDAAFCLPSFLKRHMKRHETVEKRQKCTLCNTTYISYVPADTENEDTRGRQTAQQVCQNDAPAEPFVCHRCDTTSTQHEAGGDMLAQHPRKKVDALTCHQCDKIFRRQSQLDQHRLLHTGEKPHKCKKCRKTFTFASSLRVHMQEKHSATSGKGSTDTADMGAEVRSHVCSDCGDAFKTAHLLKCHEGSHSAARDYVCKECGAAFRKYCTLNNHLQGHVGDTLYLCTECKAAFKYKTILKKHRLTHKDDRRFICEVCGKNQVTQAVLRKHMRIHTGEKKYVCDDCGAAFIHKITLMNHLKKCPSKGEEKRNDTSPETKNDQL